MRRSNTSPSYLIRNSYSYCFRMRVPEDLQNPLCKKELRYSLRTGYLSDAKFKARVMAGLVQTLFRKLRDLKTMKLTDEQIQKIATDHLKHLVENLTGPPAPLDDDLNPFIASLALKKKLESLSLDKFQITVDMETGRYHDVIEQLPGILEEHDIDFDQLDQEDDSFVRLCQAILRAHHRAIEHYEAKVEGRGPNDELDAAMDEIVGSTPAKANLSKVEAKPVPLKILLDEYWKKKQGNWTGAAFESYDRYTRRLLEHFGEDRDIKTIDYKAMEQLRDTLKEVGNSGKPIADKTVNLHLEFYSGVFNHAIQSRRITHNPVSGVKFSDKRKKQLLNDPFPKEDLIKLFNSKEYTNGTFLHGWNFWLPILLLYTGARLEELCQLYIDEIKTIDGVWVLDIDETRSDQKVKDHEKRLIPLHPFITEELNFIAYAHGLPDQDGRLFPELKRIGTKSKRPGGKDRLRYGFKPSTSWFPAYKKRCGVVAPPRKKTIHSFRHNVSSCLMEQDVQEYVIAMLLGHDHPQISTGRYGKKFEPDLLMEKAVMKLDYEIDLTHLKDSKWVVK